MGLGGPGRSCLPRFELPSTAGLAEVAPVMATWIRTLFEFAALDVRIQVIGRPWIRTPFEFVALDVQVQAIRRPWI